MLKKLLFFLLIPAMGFSQSLDLSVDNSTAGNRYTTFPLGQQNVTFSNTSIGFSGSSRSFGDYITFAVSPDYSSIAVLKSAINDGGRAFILDTDADTLFDYDVGSVSYDDPSVALYPLSSGELLIQKNIAGFTLYNSLGDIETSGSSSSSSERGESISEAVMDPMGSTILLYTPKIKGQNGFDSQAFVLADDGTATNIFYGSGRFIKFGNVSEDGQFVVLITAAEGGDDEVLIMDRHGNRISSITTDEELTGAYLTDSKQQILLHTNRRALVYNTLSGERIGSTSLRAPLILAGYFPEDNTILAMTGSKVEGTEIYREAEFHAINLEQREIARQELGGALGTSKNIDLKFTRTGNGTYRLLGANKIVNLNASF